MKKYFSLLFVVFAVVSTAISCSDDDVTSADKKAAANRKNKEYSEAWLVSNRDSAGVIETYTGLQYKIDSLGTGVKPGPEDSIHIVYTGKLANGTMFASASIKMTVDEQIPGMREGIQLMPEGSVFDLYVPYYLAYGDDENSFVYNNDIITISPYSALNFHVKLVKVVPQVTE